MDGRLLAVDVLDVHIHAHAQLRELDENKGSYERALADSAGKADAQRSIVIKPEWVRCNLPVAPYRLL